MRFLKSAGFAENGWRLHLFTSPVKLTEKWAWPERGQSAAISVKSQHV
jgi:hypothetical protein